MFTYHLYHRPTDLHYYGARWAKGATPDTLWDTYFTSCKVIHGLIELYGKDSFDVEVRKTFNTISETRKWEQEVLRRLNVTENKKWINTSLGTGFLTNGATYGMLGKKHSRKTKKLMSEKQSGRNNPMYGKTHSEEARKKISEAGKDRTYTAEQIENYKKAAKKRGIAETTRLASQSKEANEKRRKTLLGHTVSNETKEKIRKANSGKKWYNNGSHQTRAHMPPGPDYVRGRMK